MNQVWRAQLPRSGASRRGDVFKLIEEFLHRGGAVLDGRQTESPSRVLFHFHRRGRRSCRCRASGGAAGECRPAFPRPCIFFEVPTHMDSVIECLRDSTLLARYCAHVGMAWG